MHRISNGRKMNREEQDLNRKRLMDQLQVLAAYKVAPSELNVEFVRVHAQEIVRLCHLLTGEDRTGLHRIAHAETRD